MHVINTKENFWDFVSQCGFRKIFLVHDASFPRLTIASWFDNLPIPFVSFSAFSSNPVYEDVVAGTNLFLQEKCDAIIALGGGSSIDTAKCVKLFSPLDLNRNCLTQDYVPVSIPLIAVPTTAGTGSEATRFAVIYYKGKKQSVTHPSLVPNESLLIPSALTTLPDYQKKCTLLDALCQGIESWWSVNSTPESRAIAQRAVEQIMRTKDAYLTKTTEENALTMLRAAHLSGEAINITQTTAAHAMSYKLTSLFGIPHGGAVALCLPAVWEYMNLHPEHCIDPRGSEYLAGILDQIALTLGAGSALDAPKFFRGILADLQIMPPVLDGSGLCAELAKSVNLTRLRNNPVELSEQALISLYRQISAPANIS